MSTAENGRFGITSRVGNFISQTPEVPLLLLLIAFYMFVANYFAWTPTLSGGLTNFSGGSDPYWNYYMIQYILAHKHMLTFTNVINYPVGTWNPRNGTFHWMIIFVAYLFSPFYNVNNAAAFGLLEIDAVFGALLIIPVYLITNEVFGKKAGMLGAILYALMPSNFSSGILSDARTEHTPILLFALFTIYFFIRTMHFIGKERVFSSLLDIRHFPSQVLSFIRKNRLATIYAFLSAACLGSLMVAWQGFAYIEAIIAIYVVVQLVLNLISRRPTGYITYVSAIFFLFSLAMGYYYYKSLHELGPWWTSALYIAIIALVFAVLINVIGNRPWVITLPLIAIAASAGLFALNIVDPSALNTILAGDGYFIKTRVYQTIAEASSPALGTYISGFGVAQFLLGMAGVVYTIYLFLRKKNDLLLAFVVFALVSIYMSFSASRFNITAGPAYAAMGGATLAFFAHLVKMSELKRRTPAESSGVRKAVRGNISAGRLVFVIVAVLMVIVPSGFGVINAAVPANNAYGINQNIYSSLPSFLKPLVNYSSTNDQFVGTYSFYITNNSQAEPMAFNWLSTQDTNVPIEQRPAFVSWWDYGFQEVIQGQHPTVADDFQQGYEVGGQTLLAQNQSQILSLWIGRILQGAYQSNGNTLSSSTINSMETYLGQNETAFLQSVISNPGQYSTLIAEHPGTYGKYISALTGQNAYFILFTGSLSTQYSLNTLVNLYQALETDTGYHIQYVYIDQGLLPQSGTNPGIFYAPTYLTDHPSYTYQGEIVPYQYYQIYSITSNGTQYQLNQTPNTAIISSYQISYSPAFYNTSIYRMAVGYPPQALGSGYGIPGLTVNTTTPAMPDWNMSNFIISYAGVPWNPYTDYKNHSSAWKIIPIQQAYTYQQEKKGTVEILPALSSVISGWDTISSYYPGAQLSGRVTLSDGTPAAGVYVTIFDQYGIPHQYVKTDKNGYYNITALPGNDSVYVSSGAFDLHYLIGTHILAGYTLNVSKQQAERMVQAASLGGLPGYEISHDFVLSTGSLTGALSVSVSGTNSTSPATVASGQLVFKNVASSNNYTVNVTNGRYTLSNAVPGEYNVSLVTPNGTFQNFTTANVTTSSQTTNLNAQLDAFRVYVKSGNATLTGVTVYASSAGYHTSGITNSSSYALLGVPPGSYMITTGGGNFTSISQNHTFTAYNQNSSITLNPIPSIMVNGTVVGSSSAMVTFMRNGIYNENYSTQASGGKFSIALPTGYYTVYAKSGSLVSAQSEMLTTDSNLVLKLAQGYFVNVTALSKSVSLQSGYIEAMSASGLLMRSPTSSSTYFNFLLPTGVYGFESTFTSTGLSVAGFRSYQILGNLSFSIQLSYQFNLSVSVSNSVSSSSFGSGSAVSDGVVVEEQAGVPVFYTNLSSSGSAAMVHPFGSGTLYSVEFIGPGFTNTSENITGGVQTLSLKAAPILSKISISFAPNGISSVSGSVVLTGPESYSFPIVNNTATGMALPGVYGVRVSSTSGTVNLTSSIAVVQYSANYTQNTGYQQYYSITSTISSFVVFDSNGNRVNPSYLVPGPYSVYSYSGPESNITHVYVNGDVKLDPHLLASEYLKLNNSGGLTGGVYTITSGANIVFTSGVSILLPYGNYTVSYMQNYSEAGSDFSASGSTYVSTFLYTSVNVPLTISKITTSLSGTVTSNGNPMASVIVKVYRSDGAQVANGTTNNSGGYSFNLPGGNYTVYASFQSYSLAAIAVADVPSFSGPVSRNISLVTAYNVQLSETRTGNLVTGNITIRMVTAKMLFNTTDHTILLPGGSYAFNGSVMTTLSNYTGKTIDVYWNKTVNQYIAANGYVTIVLEKVVKYSFASGMLSNVTTTDQGSSISNQRFYLQNNGNSYVNLTFEPGLSDLNATVNQSKVQLAPGQNVSLLVNLDLPAEMNAGLDTLPVNASYSSGNYTVKIKVNITASPGFKEYLIPSRNYVEGNSYVVPVNISNYGNTREVLNVTIDGSNLSTNYGWVANISGSFSTTITLSPFQERTLYLNITPVGNNYFYSGTVHMVVKSTAGTVSNFSIPVILPNHIKITSVTGGTGVSQFNGNPEYTLLAGIVIIVVAVVGGLVGASYRGRKNR